MADIYVFGDSNSWGAWDARGGWVDRLKCYFAAKKLNEFESDGTSVINLAVSGDASDNLVLRIENEIAVRRKRWSTDHDLFIVAIGGNDSRLKGSGREAYITTEDYTQNLARIAHTIKKYSQNILFVGLTPVIDELADYSDTAYKQERVKEFNNVLINFCSTERYPVIQILESVDIKRHLCPDGLHLNTQGHSHVYKKVLPIAEKMIA